MKGDFSRLSFEAHKHYTGVRMQQGRVQLDADWNEQIDILLHQLQTRTDDLLGQCGIPNLRKGFELSLEDENAEVLTDLKISPGRAYVSGVLCENEEATSYKGQPHGSKAEKVLLEEKNFWVYLEVWERHITALEDPTIREVALDGPDTTTRTQTIWQANLLEVPEESPAKTAWTEYLASVASTGKLAAEKASPAGTLDNQLYRVEIHHAEGDTIGFKWSRENGSIAYRIQAKKPADDVSSMADSSKLVLQLETTDAASIHLEKGNWVEISDDTSELESRVFSLLQIDSIELDTSTITLVLPSDAGADIPTIDDVSQMQNPVLRRWDGKESDSQGQLINLGEHKSCELENGLSVRFAASRTYRVGDFWLITVRGQAEGGLIWPKESDGDPALLPPIGNRRYYCPLALVHKVEGKWQVTPAEEVEPEWLQDFDTLPQVTKRSRRNKCEIDKLKCRVDELEEKVDKHVVKDKGRLYKNYITTDNGLKTGHLVALVPESDQICRADLENERLAIGVAEEEVGSGEFRVIVHGFTECAVTGSIQAGDPLVPSANQGHAKSAPLFIRPGTVVGKALGNFSQADIDNQIGKVNVFVSIG